MKKFDFTEYLTPLYDLTDEQIDRMVERIDFPSLNDNILNGLVDIFGQLIPPYTYQGYHLIPIYLEDINDRIEVICNYWSLEMYRNAYLFNNLTLIDEQIKLTGLSPNKSESIQYNNTVTDDKETVDAYGKIIDRDVSNTSKDMSENAPINADIETINTPDNKRIGTATGHTTDEHSGEDTSTVSGSSRKTGTDTRTANSPEYTKMFMELAKEYDVYNIIDGIIRKGIWEFNRAI